MYTTFGEGYVSQAVEENLNKITLQAESGMGNISKQLN